jgi:hypothetical protein
VTNHDGSMKYYLSFFNYCCLFIVFTVLGIKLRALHFLLASTLVSLFFRLGLVLSLPVLALNHDPLNLSLPPE